MFSNLVKHGRLPVQDDFTPFDGTLDPTTGMITAMGTGTKHVIVVSSKGSARRDGEYALTWTGTGTCTLTASGSNAVVLVGTPTSNRAVYDITFGRDESGVIQIEHSDTTITGIELCKVSLEGTVGPGQENEFDPEYVALHKSRYRGGIRFMTALKTNNKETATYIGQGANPEPITGIWANRNTDQMYATGGPDAADFNAYGLSNEGGMTYEACIRFAEKCDANPWISLPVQATDDYASQFADLMLEVMPPRMQLELELGNELWNTQFQAYHFCNEQGLVEVAANPGRINNASFPAVGWGVLRSYQIFEIVKAKFVAAGRGEDLVRLASFQKEQSIPFGYTKYLETDCDDTPRTDVADPPVTPAYKGFDAITTGSYTNGKLWGETQWSNNGALDDAGVKETYTQNTKNMSNAQLLAARIVEIDAQAVRWKDSNDYFHTLVNDDGNNLEAWIYEGHNAHDSAVGAGPLADTTLHAQLDFLHGSDDDGKNALYYAIKKEFAVAGFDKGYLFHSMGRGNTNPTTGDWTCRIDFDGPNTRGKWIDFGLGGGREYMA